MAITALSLNITDAGFEIVNTETKRAIFVQNNHPNNGVWNKKSIAEMGKETFNQYLDNSKQEVLQQVAANRYAFETGGVTVDGVTIQTDRESQATVNAAYTVLKGGLVTTIDWKGTNGWSQIDLSTVEFFAKSIAVHTQYSFSQERRHGEEIAAITTFEDLIAHNANSGFTMAEKDAFLSTNTLK